MDDDLRVQRNNGFQVPFQMEVHNVEMGLRDSPHRCPTYADHQVQEVVEIRMRKGIPFPNQSDHKNDCAECPPLIRGELSMAWLPKITRGTLHPRRKRDFSDVMTDFLHHVSIDH